MLAGSAACWLLADKGRGSSISSIKIDNDIFLHRMKVDVIWLALFCVINLCQNAANGGFASTSKLKTFPAPSRDVTDEAVQVFQSYYPKRKSNTNLPWSSWGVPSRDLDGTKYTVVASGKGIFEKTVAEQRAAFVELSRVYGSTQALEMTRAVPTVLAFNKSNFAPSLIELIKIFGDDEARSMVGRNPGLLALKPYGPGSAATANDQTMKFSYIISATRPYGRSLLYGLLLLLCVPVFESLTGITIRANVLNAFNV